MIILFLFLISLSSLAKSEDCDAKRRLEVNIFKTRIKLSISIQLAMEYRTCSEQRLMSILEEGGIDLAENACRQEKDFK